MSMSDKNVIWSNDVYELWSDEGYQQDAYQNDIDNGIITEDTPFDEWKSEYFDHDYDGMNIEAENMAWDFKENIQPMIEAQANQVPDLNEWGGKSPIFLVGGRSGWRAGKGGMAFDDTDAFADWLLYRDYDNTTELQNDNGVLYLVSYDHDGSTAGTLYTLPTTKEGMMNLIKNCTNYADDVADYRDEYPGLSDDEIMWELFYQDTFGYQYETNWRDLTQYPEYLEPIKVNW